MDEKQRQLYGKKESLLGKSFLALHLLYLPHFGPVPAFFGMIDKSVTALERADARFFATHMPREEWWRLYPNFESKAVFLDIETTGLSHYYDEITVVGF